MSIDLLYLDDPSSRLAVDDNVVEGHIWHERRGASFDLNICRSNLIRAPEITQVGKMLLVLGMCIQKRTEYFGLLEHQIK